VPRSIDGGEYSKLLLGSSSHRIRVDGRQSAVFGKLKAFAKFTFVNPTFAYLLADDFIV
jgi:hypothetical protein